VERRVQIPYRLTADPAAEGFTTVYTVPPGAKLKLREVTVSFPIGTYGELEVALYYGETRGFPEERPITGDGVSVSKKVELNWFSQDEVRLWYKNYNTTQKRQAYLNLEGILE